MENPVFETPLPNQKDFSYWSDRFKLRQNKFKETSQIENRTVSISFKEDTLINFIGDTHVGSPNSYYDRLETEVKTILKKDNSFVILVGDLVDGFFFNPAQMEQIEQVQEQWAYVDSLLKTLASKSKILMGFAGDHDKWSQKMGVDPYYKFATELGAHYMHGVGN